MAIYQKITSKPTAKPVKRISLEDSSLSSSDTSDSDDSVPQKSSKPAKSTGELKTVDPRNRMAINIQTPEEEFKDRKRKWNPLNQMFQPSAKTQQQSKQKGLRSQPENFT